MNASLLALLAVPNVQAVLGPQVAELSELEGPALLQEAVAEGVADPAVLDVELGPDADLDLFIIAIARARAEDFLDDQVNLPEPWEYLSDILIARALDVAIGRIDTREERREVVEHLKSLGLRLLERAQEVGDRRRARKLRRQAAKEASRA